MIQKIKSFLPLFSGFYETVWDVDSILDSAIIEINETRTSNNLYELEMDDDIIDDFDYEEYKNQVINHIASELVNNISYIKDINIEKVNSPRYYNYSNDSADVEITIDTEELKEEIYKLYDDVKEAIKSSYTSRDGFLSSYSNNITDWEEDTNGFTDFSINEHFLGAILDIIIPAIITEDNLYCSFNPYPIEFIGNLDHHFNKVICNECDEYHSMVDYKSTYNATLNEQLKLMEEYGVKIETIRVTPFQEWYNKLKNKCIYEIS